MSELAAFTGVMHSPHFAGCSVATLGPNRYPNADSKFKEQAAIARASEIASLSARHIKDTCGFTPPRLAINYILTWILQPFYTHDELLKFVHARLERTPGARVSVEELYETWRALKVRKQADPRPLIGSRTFKAPEIVWRHMLLDRGVQIAGDELLGFKRRAMRA